DSVRPIAPWLHRLCRTDCLTSNVRKCPPCGRALVIGNRDPAGLNYLAVGADFFGSAASTGIFGEKAGGERSERRRDAARWHAVLIWESLGRLGDVCTTPRPYVVVAGRRANVVAALLTEPHRRPLVSLPCDRFGKSGRPSVAPVCGGRRLSHNRYGKPLHNGSHARHIFIGGRPSAGYEDFRDDFRFLGTL